MSLGGGYGAWLDAMSHDPDKYGTKLGEFMSLPEDLDYKIVRGFEGSQTIDIVIFSKEQFEETGCEFESEVFRITVTNVKGQTDIQVQEEQVTNIELF